ncbi:hypothetical protein FRB99_002495, partial [Tulasnella sp. 403]
MASLHPSEDIALERYPSNQDVDVELDSPPPSSPANWQRALSETDSAAPDTALELHPMASIVDSGFHAWAFLFSAFTVEFLVWSYPYSYGVFLNYYQNVLFSPDDPQFNLLPLIGTLSPGIIYIGSLLVLPFVLRYPGYRSLITLGGIILCILGLVGAGFSTRPLYLVMTQGVVFSVGATMLFFPVVTLLVEWWCIKRGLANGILNSGTGIGGIVVPFLADALLRRFGHRLAFLILAGVFGVLAFPAYMFAKPRLPITQITAANP